MKTAPPSSLPRVGADPEALVKEARRRQHRRYMAVGLAIVVMLAGAAAITVSVTGPGDHAPSRPGPRLLPTTAGTSAVWKAMGPQPLIEAIDITVSGGTLEASRFPTGASPLDIPRIHSYFKKGKGATAARLARAIASGRAVNHETLASAAHVGYDTAAKLVDYLGPLIKDRREHGNELKMTPEVVYRWSGEHARYILSWCRRNGYSDIATRVTAAVVS